jgi:hypothetical protein
MDVGRQTIRFVERADANEADCFTGAGVIAPKRYPTAGTSGDSLTLAAVRWGVDDLNVSLEQLHTIGLD